MKHTLITFIADIDGARRPDLDALMEAMDKDPAANALLPFGFMPSIHYASFSIFPNELVEAQDTLVFEINADGDLEELLDQLFQQGKRGLEAVFGCCEGFEGGTRMRAFLKSKLQKPAAWHIGNVGLSVTRIRDEQCLRLDIAAHLDDLRGKNLLPHGEAKLYDEICRFASQAHSWALQSAPRQTRAEVWLPQINLWGTVLLVGSLLLWGWRVTIPGLLLVWRVLRWHEKKEARETPPVLSFDRQAEQEIKEYGQGQNHVSSLIRVQSSPFRRALLRLVLCVVNLNARISTKGELGGIPSIHFAHWSLVDGGKRLLFVSNYDNSWGSYLDDFSDKANGGLTAIWSNTRYFPPTWNLIKEGARAGARFKNWVRLSQEPVRVWYRAYPSLSVGNIERNSKIRQGLSQNLQGQARTDYLHLF